MTNERALAHVEPAAPIQIEWTPEKIQLLKEQVLKYPQATDTEMELFILECDQRRLNPFARQIYAVWRYNKQFKRKVMVVQTGIDGFRLIAKRTGQFGGRVGPFWCGEDGEWRDTWFKKEHPAAAKVGVRILGQPEPTFAVAHWDEYAQTFDDGNPMGLWGSMPRQMIAKCAESQALRAAFPEELSGLYTTEEMSQADGEPIDFEEQRRQHHAKTHPDLYDPEGFDPETGEIFDGEWEEVYQAVPITEQQTKLIARLIEDVPEDERHAYFAKHNAKSIGTLSKDGASRLIDDLKRVQAEKAKAMTEEPEDEVLMGYLQDLRKLGGKPNPQVMAQATGGSARKHVVSKIRDTLIEKIEAAQTFDALSGLEVEWREHVGWTKKLQATFEEKSAALAEAGVTE